MNLNWTQILLLICICIEVYHVLCRDYVMSITKPVVERYKLSQAYENMITGIMRLSEYMHDHPELSKHIKIETLIEMLKLTQETGGPKTFRRNLLDELPLKHLGIYLSLQAIEVVYWIIAFILACILPYGMGAVMFIVLIVLSTINDKNNKANNQLTYYYFVDSFLCIVMYIVLICNV